MDSKSFSKYGIDFRLVENIEDVELLRRTRNLAHVRQQMYTQHEISAEEHGKWFQQLDHERNFYFIYGMKKVDIGVVNISKIDYSSRIGEAGVYVANQNYLGSHLNIGALLFLYGYAFENLNLELIRARILSSNVKAIRMNLFLGFRLVNAEEDTYLLNEDNYRQSKRKFEHVFSR